MDYIHPAFITPSVVWATVVLNFRMQVGKTCVSAKAVRWSTTVLASSLMPTAKSNLSVEGVSSLLGIFRSFCWDAPIMFCRRYPGQALADGLGDSR